MFKAVTVGVCYGQQVELDIFLNFALKWSLMIAAHAHSFGNMSEGHVFISGGQI